jgi:hypothetical protein
MESYFAWSVIRFLYTAIYGQVCLRYSTRSLSIPILMRKQTSQPAVAPAHFHPLRLKSAYSDLHKRLCLPSAVAFLRNMSRPAPLTDGQKPPANTLSHCSSDEIFRHQNILFASNHLPKITSPALRCILLYQGISLKLTVRALA